MTKMTKSEIKRAWRALQAAHAAAERDDRDAARFLAKLSDREIAIRIYQSQMAHYTAQAAQIHPELTMNDAPEHPEPSEARTDSDLTQSDTDEQAIEPESEVHASDYISVLWEPHRVKDHSGLLVEHKAYGFIGLKIWLGDPGNSLFYKNTAILFEPVLKTDTEQVEYETSQAMTRALQATIQHETGLELTEVSLEAMRANGRLQKIADWHADGLMIERMRDWTQDVRPDGSPLLTQQQGRALLRRARGLKAPAAYGTRLVEAPPTRAHQNVLLGPDGEPITSSGGAADRPADDTDPSTS